MKNKLLNLKEAVDYIGIPEDEFLEIINRGKIPTYKIGGLYTRFKIEDLDSYKIKASKRVLKNHLKRPAVQKTQNIFIDRIKDFFYFYDFYIYSCAAIIFIIYCILK